MILAISFCAVVYSALWLLVALLQEYIDIFAIALVTSLAMRPLKHSIHYYLVIGYSSDKKFPYLQYSLLFKLPELFSSGTLGYLVVFASMIIYKLSFSHFLFFSSSILFIDLIFKLFLGFFIKLTSLIFQKKLVLLDTVLTFMLILLLVIILGMLQTFIFGSVAWELTQKGKVLIDFFVGLVDEDPLESFKSSPYSRVLNENFGDIWRNMTEVPVENANVIQGYINYGRGMPVVGGIVNSGVAIVDLYLSDLGLSAVGLLYMLNSIPSKTEYIWKTVIFALKTVFGNIGGVAYKISYLLERIILYFTLVSILVKGEGKVVEKAIGLVPLSKELQNEISADIVKTVAGITTSFVMAFLIHYVVTLATFLLLGLEFKFLFSALAAAVGFFPYFGAWVMTLPMIGYLLFNDLQKCLILFAVEYFLIGFLDSKVYTSQLGYFNESMIGIVIVLGIYKFGFFGIFYGPLIMALGYLMFKVGNSLNITNN
jgi:predicted PurR-regulated permease PerM